MVHQRLKASPDVVSFTGESWKTLTNGTLWCFRNFVDDLACQCLLDMITHEGTAMVGLTLDAAFLKHRFNAALAGAVWKFASVTDSLSS